MDRKLASTFVCVMAVVICLTALTAEPLHRKPARIPGTTLTPSEPGNAADYYVKLFASVGPRTHGGHRQVLKLAPGEIELLVKGSRRAECSFHPEHYPRPTGAGADSRYLVTALLVANCALEQALGLVEHGEHDQGKRLMEAVVAFDWHLYREGEFFSQKVFAALWLLGAYRTLQEFWSSQGEEELAAECRTQVLSFGLVDLRHRRFLIKSQEDFSFCREVLLKGKDPMLKKQVILSLTGDQGPGSAKEIAALFRYVGRNDPEPLVRETATNALRRLKAD